MFISEIRFLINKSGLNFNQLCPAFSGAIIMYVEFQVIINNRDLIIILNVHLWIS